MILIFALAACQAAGTVRSPRIAFDAERDLGTVAFVALPVEPQVELKGFASGRETGALGAAGATFTGCTRGLGSFGSCGGSLGAAVCGAAVLLWLGVCTVATGASAVAGATLADSARSVQANMTIITASLGGAKIQEGLRHQVAKAAAEAGTLTIAVPSSDAVARAAADRNYTALAAAGIDNVVETSLTKIGTMGTGIDPPLTLYMLAHVRVINTHDNSERAASNHSYVSEQHPLREWAADQGALLQRALQSGFARLGASIADRVVRGYSFPSADIQDKESLGLAAVYPKTIASSTRQHLEWEANWTKIDSLQPTLQWQSFPRQSDRAAAPEEMARVRDVRYDVMVAEEVGLGAGPVVASAYGIKQSNYRVEPPLKPGKRYFWTVRASFEFDGARRVTPWAVANSGLLAVTFKVITAHAFPEVDALWALAQPGPASYRFETGRAPGKDAAIAPSASSAEDAVAAPVSTVAPSVAMATAASMSNPMPTPSLPRVGDTWTYNVLNGGQKADTLQVVVTALTEDRVTESLTDSKSQSFKAIRTFGVSFDPRVGFQESELPGRFFLAEFSPYAAPSSTQIGMEWEGVRTTLTITLNGKVREDWRLTVKTLGRERVRVPAGEFDAVKVKVVSDRHRWADAGDGIVRLVFWYAPEVKRTVKMVRRLEGSKVIVSYTDVYELASYKIN